MQIEHASATERALIENSERYRSLFAYNPHAAFSLDLEGQFIDTNAVAVELSGYTQAELRSMHFIDVVCEEDIPRVATAFEEVVNRRPQQLEARVVHREGHVIDLSITAMPVVVGDEVVGVHGIAEDITERNELRRELERTQRVAEEASAAKSLFLANISHEVRTPLTSLLAATELLRETEMDTQQDRFAEMIVQSGKTAAAAGQRHPRLLQDRGGQGRAAGGRGQPAGRRTGGGRVVRSGGGTEGPGVHLERRPRAAGEPVR